MSVEGLEIRIGADLNKALKGLEVLRKELNDAADQGGDAMKRLASSFGGVESKLRGLNNSVSSTQAPLRGMAKGSNEAMFAMTNLSRVVQDAPYGFLGIANNLNPLLESFQRLKASTGTTGAALKALGSSLMGAGGLGLILGAVSTLLVLFGDRIFNTGKKAKEANTALKETKRTLEEIAGGTAGSSIANLEKFSAALTDVSLSTNTRKKALEEYNKVAAEGNRISETDLNNIGKISEAIQNQINLLKTRALIKGAEETMAEAFKKIYENQFKIRKELNKQLPTLQDAADIYGNINREQKEFGSGLTFDQTMKYTTRFGLDRGETTAALAGNIRRATDAAREASAPISDLRKFIAEMVKEAEQFGGAFDGIKAKGKELQNVTMTGPLRAKVEGIAELNLVDAKVQLKGLDAAKATLDLPNIKINTGNLANLNKAVAGVRDQFEWEWTRRFEEADLKLPKVDFQTPDLNGLNDTLTRIYEFTKQVQGIMVQLGTDIATTIGEGLGNILSGKGVGEAFRGVFQAIGGALTRLGAVMIATSKLMAKFKAAFAAMQPAAQMLTGVAMVALGQVVKNVAATPFAAGGIVSGPTYALMGEYPGAKHNPEVIAPLNKLKDLIQPTSASMPEYLPVMRLEGSTLLMMYQRAQNQNRRYS